MARPELVCPRCHAALEGVTRPVCSSCGTVYQAVDGVPVLLADSVSSQQAAQREYFDAEFSALESYELPNWRLSFLERIVNALGIFAGARFPVAALGQCADDSPIF